MRLAALTQTSAAVAATRSRLQKRARLADTLRALEPGERAIGCAYLNGILPQGRIGLGPATLRDLHPEPARHGSLTLNEVDARFKQIAEVSGKGSAAARRETLGGLFAQCTTEEQDFLRRLILGELRQGALEGVMIEAIAEASAIDAAQVRRAVMLSGEIAAVATTALEHGAAGLQTFRLELMRPVQPMLAQTSDTPAEAVSALGETALDYKLDGARIQLHKDGGAVRVFTRRLHEVTDRVPELVEEALAWPARTLILDGEAIALQPDGRPHPFQVTMRRFGRRLGVETMRSELPLTAVYFDCLHLDGDDLIDAPLRERHRAMSYALPEASRVERLMSADAEAADAFFERALAAGHEGIMAKSLAAPYEAGSRGAAWLKLKAAHTLDLVVLAAEWGSGRREGWLSNLHLGARDTENGGFVMLGKTFKGLTDALLRWQTKELLAREMGREEHVVHVRPELVVEIAFNELQASPQYPGGLALRFARVKGYRGDKTAVEADTMETVRAIYSGQNRGG